MDFERAFERLDTDNDGCVAVVVCSTESSKESNYFGCVVLCCSYIDVMEFRTALGELVAGLSMDDLRLLAAHFDLDGECYK